MKTLRAALLLVSPWLLQAKAFAPTSSSSSSSHYLFTRRPSILHRPGPRGGADVAISTETTDNEQVNGAFLDDNNNNPENQQQQQQQAVINDYHSEVQDSKPLLPENEHQFLKEALLESVLFTSLPEESLEALISAFERTEYLQNDAIFRQGDTCENDFVYVVGEGQCVVEVDGKMVPPPYGILRPKTIFGELGIMYNQTRTATISCRTPTLKLFRIPGDDFKNILNQRIAADAENEDKEQLEAIDDVIKEIEGTKSLYAGAIIRPYKPNRLWLWRRFTGTILQHVAAPTLLNMLWSTCVILFVRHRTMAGPWGGPPDPTHPLIAKLSMVHKIWSYQQGLTAFILTFFLNQAFSFWREIYDLGRRIQGRLNDFNVILATTAARKKDGSYTDKAESLLDDVGQISRLFHALLWAANARRFRVLCTPRGLERMASRGLMTSRQLDVLQNLDLPEDQKHNACLEWMMIRTDRGIQDGTLISDAAHRQMLLGQIATLRCTYAMIADKLDGRMPLAYTHFVQVLVDVFVWTAPLALYSELGAWSVICVGILTVFYSGLLDLAKIFLDPLDNEDFCRNSIYMDIGVLIRESNAGSTRWVNGAATLPF